MKGYDQCQRIKNKAEMPVEKLRSNAIPERLMATYISGLYYKVTSI